MRDYNPARGDVLITLLEHDYIMRPSFQAIACLEDHFKRGIIDIARDYHNSKITHASDFLAIIKAGFKGAAQPEPADLPDRIIAAGLTQLIEPCGQFLAHACGIRG
jgi:Phage tail tube protein, GTA-gp10